MTLEELRQLRAANPGAYESNIKRVVVDNDKPGSPGVWQNVGVRSVEMDIVVGRDVGASDAGIPSGSE